MALSRISTVLFLALTVFIHKGDSCSENFYHQSSFWEQEFFSETGVITPVKEDICSRRISLPVNSTRVYRVSSLQCNVTLRSISLSSSLFTINVLRAQSVDDKYVTLSMETIIETNLKSEYKMFLSPLHNCTLSVMAKSILLHFMMIYVDFEVSVSEGNASLPPEPNCDVVDHDGHFWNYPVKYVLNDIPLGKDTEMSVYEFDVACPKECNCSLRHKEWLRTCGKYTGKKLLICNPHLGGLSFFKRKLNTIHSDAFRCFTYLRKLMLSRNRLIALPKDIFSELNFFKISRFESEQDCIVTNRSFCAAIQIKIFDTKQ